MNKRTLIIILLTIVAAVAYWKRDMIKQKILMLKNQASGSSESSHSSSGSAGSGSYNSSGGYVECKDFPLKYGCRGELVSKMQAYLNKDFGANLSIDGKFGKQTEAALEKAGFGKTLEKEEALKHINKNT